MSFKDFLSEEKLSSSPEQQNTQTKADAKQIIAQIRGLAQGRSVVAKSTASSDPFSTSGEQAPNSVNDKDPLILKNDGYEAVIVDKDPDGQVFITLVNKQKQTKRTIALDSRGGSLLKRYI